MRVVESRGFNGFKSKVIFVLGIMKELMVFMVIVCFNCDILVVIRIGWFKLFS